MPETGLWVYALGGDAAVVAPDGSQWIVEADPATLLGPDGAATLAELAAAATPVEPPQFDPGDLVLASSRDLLATAAALDRDGGTPATAAWPFAGRWNRLALEPGRAADLAAEAVACLRATVPDPALAEAYCAPAASGPIRRPAAAAEAQVSEAAGAAAPRGEARPSSAGPARDTLPIVPRDMLLRWNGLGWDAHPLRPAPVADPVTGLLRRIVHRPSDPSLPPGFVHTHAELPHLASADPRLQVDALAPSGVLDEREAHDAAVLSGVEHYCGAYFGQGERRLATLAELRRTGARAVAVDEWEPHDPALHEQPGFPFARFGADAPLWWVAGEESGERCWVPLSLVHVGWREAGLEPATVFHGHNFAGMKAGRSLAEAAERACAEVVSHDAVAVWWAAGRGVRLPAAPIPDELTTAWGDCALKLRLLAVPSTVGAPVRLAVIDDAERGIVALGHAAHRFADRAGASAAAAALIQYVSARDLDSPRSLIRNAEALGNGAVAGLAPHDPERRYRDAFGPRHRGLVDPMCHVQFGLDPDVADLVRTRTTPAEGPMPAEREGTAMRSLLERDGHRVAVVDATAARVRSAGLHVARVIVPGLARIQPAAFPLDPGGRLARAAARLGWAAGETEPVPYPGW